MFKITPIQSVSDAEKYANYCGAVIKNGCFVYAMTDCESGEVMGFSQFEILDGYGYIYDVKEAIGKNDFEAMFILGRQTMNFIELCGARTVKASDAYTDSSLLRAIGFKKLENGEYFCDMEGMFDGKHCSGHAVDLEEAANN